MKMQMRIVDFTKQSDGEDESGSGVVGAARAREAAVYGSHLNYVLKLDRRYLSGPPLLRLLRRLQVPRAPASTTEQLSNNVQTEHWYNLQRKHQCCVHQRKIIHHIATAARVRFPSHGLALFNFLDLQYQGNDSVSPLQSHRKTMWVAVSSLLLYCSSYELEPRFTQLGRVGMGVFGSILSVSLTSLLFQNSVSFALYFLYVLFFDREVLCSCIELFWSWIHQKTIADPLREIQMVNRRLMVMPASVNRGGLLPL
ncbi:hypothetical protein RHSIM_Rhsim07G0114500 [Rhododendron simsii]|uniref:Uncharacterized protein n=1 Tax=Rhododendron simsii TaxID=118357 RepID=A0A834GUL3_RHOSS|nr:hypothetical protein RHSIM_Rhsim07G0114500 [Rhododendron simsii]